VGSVPAFFSCDSSSRRALVPSSVHLSVREHTLRNAFKRLLKCPTTTTTKTKQKKEQQQQQQQ